MEQIFFRVPVGAGASHIHFSGAKVLLFWNEHNTLAYFFVKTLVRQFKKRDNFPSSEKK